MLQAVALLLVVLWLLGLVGGVAGSLIHLLLVLAVGVVLLHVVQRRRTA